MKKILTLGLAFLILAMMPQIASAQSNTSKEKVESESKKETKKETKKEKKSKKEKKAAKEDTQKMTDSEHQEKVVAEKEVTEEKVNKNEPRPYVSQKIEKPVNAKPKAQHKVNDSEKQ